MAGGLFGLGVNRWNILFVIMLTVLIASLDQTVVATAMPTIILDLGGLGSMSLVFAAYMTAALITVTISGSLGDIYGRKKLYIIGIALFTIGSFLCGFSQDMQMLIAFRAMQGAGAGMLMVLSMAMMGDIFSPRERGKWISLIAAIYGLGSIFGPMLGAFITQDLGWRWVFYVNVPIGFLAIWLMHKANYAQTLHKKANVDFAGCILFMIFIITFMSYAQTQLWLLTSMLAVEIAIIILALILFVRQEHIAAQPILPPYLFANSIFIIAIICSFILNAALFGAISFVPQYVETIMGGGPMDAGKALTPLLLSSVLSMVAVGQITSRTGKYKLVGIIATIIVCIGLWLLAGLQQGSSYSTVLIALTVLGIGLGPQTYLYTLIVQNAFASCKIGVATSGVTFFRNLGSVLGVIIFGAVINFVSQVSVITTAADKAAYLSGLQTAFTISLALSVICVFLLLVIKEIPLRAKNSGAVASG
ncbi:MAG: MFS transporter [Candidatus Micrarchaeia archaeon]